MLEKGKVYPSTDNVSTGSKIFKSGQRFGGTSVPSIKDLLPPDPVTNPRGTKEYFEKIIGYGTLNKLDKGEYVSPAEIDSLIEYSKENSGWMAYKNPSADKIIFGSLNKNILNAKKKYYSLFNDAEDYKNRKETVDLQLEYGGYTYSQLADEISRLKAESKSSKDKEKLNKKIGWLENYSVVKAYSTEKDYKDAADILQKNINGLTAERKKARSPGENEMYTQKIREKQNQLAALNNANRYVKYNQLKNNSDFKDTVARAAVSYSYLGDKAVYDGGLAAPEDFMRLAEKRKISADKEPSINAVPTKKEDYNSALKKIGSWKTNAGDFRRLTGHTYSDFENGKQEVVTPAETDSYKFTTSDENAMLVYLRETKGQSAAWDYLQDLKPVLNERRLQSELSDLGDAYNSGSILDKLGYQVMSSVGTVYGGAYAGIQDIAALVTGKEINPYSGAHFTQQAGQYIREVTAGNISGGIDNEFLSKLAATTYQGIMSGADMLLGAGILTKWGYTSAMAAGAFSSKARELYQRGATRGQIAAGASLSAVIEFATEAIGADRFFKTWNSETLKAFFKNLGVQMAAEGIEEIASDLGDLANEELVMRGNSNFETSVREYINNGMTEEQARKKAMSETLGQMAWDAYAAAVSVGISGGGRAAGLSLIKTHDAYIQSKADRSAGEAIIKSGNAGFLVDYALSVPSDIKAHKTAQSIQKNNSYSEPKQVGKLYNSLIAGLHNQITEKTRNAVVKQLEALGVEDPAEIADVIVRMAQMRETDGPEKSAVLDNPEARSVYEVLTKKMKTDRNGFLI